MKSKLMLAACAVSMLFAAPTLAAAPAQYATAIADAARPAADVERDAARKPVDMLAFAGVAPGQTVADLLPGGGYFTRIFAKAVGPKGTVYAVISEAQAKADKPPAVNAIAADPAYANVKVTPVAFETLALPTKADVIWTSLNYHDLHLTRLNVDVAKVNKAIFEALKPGGVYVVVDHAAAAGAAVDSANTLHRIDPAIVRREVEAAGFVFVSESAVLRNPADDHTKPVFDESIRGKTDQFIFKFRKPG